MKANTKEIVKDHARLMENLKIIQKFTSVSELSALLGISVNTWTNRMKEPWSKFIYDDFRRIARYCNIDFVELITGTIKLR